MTNFETGVRVRLAQDYNSYFNARGVAGRIATITKVIDQPDDEHDEEPLPMYRVIFDDPADANEEFFLAEIEVWPDEVTVLNSGRRKR